MNSKNVLTLSIIFLFMININICRTSLINNAFSHRTISMDYHIFPFPKMRPPVHCLNHRNNFLEVNMQLICCWNILFKMGIYPITLVEGPSGLIARINIHMLRSMLSKVNCTIKHRQK